jgi:Putative transposase
MHEPLAGIRGGSSMPVRGADGRARYKRMTLTPHEFIRRFLIHVLPKGLHRIRHFGLFAKATCTDNIARARELLAVPKPQVQHADGDATDREPVISSPCPCCGGQMVIIETFARGSKPRHRATTTVIKIDTS